MALLNYNKTNEITKKRAIKRRVSTIDDSPIVYDENVCFTINHKKWLIIKQLPRNFFIVKHEDIKNRVYSTQLVSLADIKNKNIKIIDFLKVRY